jgi:uncharacterized membrane protein YqhA
MRKILAGSRYLVILAVFGTFIAAVVLLIFGLIKEYLVIADMVKYYPAIIKESKELIIQEINIVDIFLLSIGFYVISMGIYELFIDDRLELPGWLVIQDFDDLKVKLISILIVVMGVLFLSFALEWEGGFEILGLGAAIGIVIVALTYFISQKSKKEKPPGS